MPVLGFVLAFSACAGSSRRATSSPPASPGTIKDPVGDSRASALVPKPPDFVAATGELRDGNVVITVAFARGTLSNQTAITVYLDTDENAATGLAAFYRDSAPIGADYVLRSLQPHDPSRMSITRETAPNQSVFGGILDVVFPDADQRRIVVPLARLGGDDGHLKFKISCEQVVAASSTAQGSTQTIVTGLDFIPNYGAPPGVVR